MGPDPGSAPRAQTRLEYAMSLRAAFESVPVHSPVHNRLAVDDQAVHRWYRFVLSFPPHLVREYLDGFGVKGSAVVLDPFCGTGTTLVECKKLGIASIGIEANPMAAFASTIKADWSMQPRDLRTSARRVCRAYHRAIEIEGGSSPFQGDDALRERRTLWGYRSLGEEQQKLILKDSISPLPLHKALILLEAIRREESTATRHLELALAWALVNEVGNVRFGPEVGISKPKVDADVLGSWLRQVNRMPEDLRAVRENAAVPSKVYHADARVPAAVLAPASVDVVITSPPYPNEKDYTRTTRLESVILGLVKNAAELRAIKKGLVRSNTRGVYVDDLDHQEVESFRSIQELAPQIEARRIAMGKTSGFERLYHRVTKLYFGGMRRHLSSLRPVLRPGARLAYVVGDQASCLQVMIRTGALLGEIAESCGYR